MSFIEKSYEVHQQHYGQHLGNTGLSPHAQTWLRQDTADFWRHDRMRSAVLPFLKANPVSRWLTVGDGRLGLDANFILRNGAQAHASDISDSLLKVSQDQRLIEDYSTQNCEKLSFSDNEFDFVFCKESYHHFPRPGVAIHEMLRVSRRGVVLIEPQDPVTDLTIFQSIFFRSLNFMKRLFGKKVQTHSFEEDGNYVYSISRREIEKTALGIGYRYVVFKDMNDFYLAGVEQALVSPPSPLFLKVKFRLAVLDFFVKVGLRKGSLLAAAILKEKPDLQFQKTLEDNGFDLIELPKNPYL